MCSTLGRMRPRLPTLYVWDVQDQVACSRCEKRWRVPSEMLQQGHLSDNAWVLLLRHRRMHHRIALDWEEKSLPKKRRDRRQAWLPQP